MKTTPLFLSLLLSLLIFSCEKTVDSETSRWKTNQATLKRLMSEYPNFKTVLESQLTKATAIYNDAIQLSDKAAKIEKMALANRTARPSYVNQLDRLDENIEDLRESVVELVGESSEPGLMIAGIKYANAESAIAEAKTYISSVSASDETTADQIVKKAVGKIKRMQKSIDDRIKAKERAAAKLEKAKEEELVK